MYARGALGESDNRGAFMYRNAKATIELEETIPDCKKVSVWARKVAWKKPTFSVEISSDGKHWTKIGKKKRALLLVGHNTTSTLMRKT